MANRATKVLGVFAEDANTVIPVTPVDGTPYRDATIAEAIAKGGWPFNTIVDSKNFNQILYNYSQLLKGLDKRGILPYSSVVDYDDLPAIVWGSDGTLYIALLDNGPDTAVVDPVGDITGTWMSLDALLIRTYNSVIPLATATPTLLATNVNSLHKCVSTVTDIGMVDIDTVGEGDSYDIVNYQNTTVNASVDAGSQFLGQSGTTINGTTTDIPIPPGATVRFTKSVTADRWDVVFLSGASGDRVIYHEPIAAGATIDLPFATLDPDQSVHNRYEIEIVQILPANDDVILEAVLSSDNGGSWPATGYYSVTRGNNNGDATVNNAATMRLAGSGSANDSLSNAAGEYATLNLSLSGFNTGQNVRPDIKVESTYWTAGGNYTSQRASVTRSTAADYDALRIAFSAGNTQASGFVIVRKKQGPTIL